MTTATIPATTGQTRNFVVATIAFTISFWAWNMIAPLGVRYAADLGLSTTQKSILVALPILVGSLGRIVAGVLTPKYGGRLMFAVLLALSAPFVVLVALGGKIESYPLLLVAGFFLGIAGTTFAVGIPFLNNWYGPEKRGMATGIFGAGIGGAALSAFFTPRFVEWFGYFATHVIIAVALLVMAGVCWMTLRDAPDFAPSTEPGIPKLIAALRLPITWQMSFLYTTTSAASSPSRPTCRPISTTSTTSTTSRPPAPGPPGSRSRPWWPARSAARYRTGSVRG